MKLTYFRNSILISLIGIVISYLWGGTKGLLLTSILAVLEISLSFDNAIVNAHILQKMSEVWRQRFLTWGILIAVFGVRICLPFLIVAMVAKLNLFEVIKLVFESPKEYAQHLHAAHYSINAFGGIFLLLVFLTFLFDKQRSIYWLGKIERKLNQIGSVWFMELLISLVVLSCFSFLAPANNQTEMLYAGIAGILLWGILHVITHLLKTKVTGHHSGFFYFMYLETLDASFSFDGMIGAFAITKDIVIIMLGLTIGAIFVRSFTIYLVHKGVLTKYLFLEHGAYYAIGALALIMLLATQFHIPEVLVGLIGFTIIGISFISSLKHNKKAR